jgi:alcohol dehydrogenase (cytochrome c)
LRRDVQHESSKNVGPLGHDRTRSVCSRRLHDPAHLGNGPAVEEAAANPANWASYNHTLDSQRFSPLDQINTGNVHSLRQHCTFDLGETANFQSGLVVVDGVLYVTSDQFTYAFDAATCDVLWQHHYDDYTPNPEGLQVNRGVAYADGRVFRGVNDGNLYAHDAATGEVLWRAPAANPEIGETLPAAPIAWDGLVFIGQAGGDITGVRGRMMAFDAENGDRVWSFDLVPMTGPGAETWPASTDENPRTGGATWTSYTLDVANGLLYVPAGNAAPDFDIAARPGLNLYTNSLVILDAETGALQAFYQLTPHDYHDWDLAAAPALFTSAGGKRLAAAAGKDGYLYVIELAAGELIYNVPLTTIFNVDAPLTPAGTRFCPGTQGGVEWNGPAWHPDLNLIFVGAVEACSTVKLLPSPPATETGMPFTHGSSVETPFGEIDPVSEWRGWLTAIEADSGEVIWQYASSMPLLAGVTPTAGGVVFAANIGGEFFAFDAETGEQLFTENLGQPIAGGIITYMVDGTQYVAIAAGMNSQLWQTEGAAQVVVYALP